MPPKTQLMSLMHYTDGGSPIVPRKVEANPEIQISQTTIDLCQHSPFGRWLAPRIGHRYYHNHRPYGELCKRKCSNLDTVSGQARPGRDTAKAVISVAR